MLPSSYLADSKRILVTAMPLVAAQLVQGSSGFISTLMLAKVGANELAACGLVSFWFFTILVLFWGMLGGTSVLTAHAYGARNKEQVKKVICQGMVFAALLCLPMLLSIDGATWFIHRLNINLAVRELAVKYLWAMAWTILPGTYLVLFEQFLLGIAKNRAVMLFSLLSVPLTIAFSYPLVFGKLGLPKMGIAGIGYGTALAYTIVIIYMLLYITRYKPFRRYVSAKRLFKIDRTLFNEFLRLGWPIGIVAGIDVCYFAVLAYFMGQLHSVALAAHQIVLQYIGLIIMVAFGFMNATTVLVSQACGRQDFNQIKTLGNLSIALGSLVTLFMGLGYMLFARHLVALDLDITAPTNQALVLLTTHLLSIAVFYQVANSARLITQGALRGLKDTKMPMFINLMAFWALAFPASYWLAMQQKWGPPGLWWGTVLGVAVGAMLIILRFQRQAASIKA
jgi:MATE family multidrug resistance protein